VELLLVTFKLMLINRKKNPQKIKAQVNAGDIDSGLFNLI